MRNLEAVLLVVLALAPQAASGQVVDKCQAAKIKAAGKKTYDKTKCHEKALKKGVEIDSLCLTKAEDKFAKAMTKADTLGSCLGTATELEAAVDQCVADYVGVLATGTTTPVVDKCQAAKIKAAGKKTYGKAKCHEKALKKGVEIDTLCLTKAEDKFTKAMTKADTLGSCPGTIDALEAAVDQCVTDVVAILSGTGTTTTTTATTTTTVCTGQGCSTTTSTTVAPTTTTTTAPTTTTTTCPFGCPTTTTNTTTTTIAGTSTTLPAVFLIVLSNHSWSDIKGNASAPYINNVLLTTGAHAEQYYTPAGIHPDEPNYIWLEAGDNLGVSNNDPPATNHKATTSHLVSLLEAAGISWKAYQEDIPGTGCPLTDQGLYVVRHDPVVFFDDVTGTNNASDPYCIAHVRPFSELTSDLGGTVARYNFITPNVCHDMAGSGLSAPCPSLFTDLVKAGDDWLAAEIPLIMASSAYTNNGVILITWDQGSGLTPSDGPIGLIALSPAAKVGYQNAIPYTHSSTLRTLQEMFGVTPLLRDAATATDLSDLFVTLP